VVTHDLAILYQIADTILVMYAGRLAEKAPAATIVKAPRHPYTKLLVGSLPEVGVRYGERRLSGLAGAPPSLLNPPSGCRFHPRCPYVMDKCVHEVPVLAPAGSDADHLQACWLDDATKEREATKLLASFAEAS